MRRDKLTFKQKIAIILDKILQIILFIAGGNHIFQFLADFNQKCSDVLTRVIAHKIYIFIRNLLIKIGG